MTDEKHGPGSLAATALASSPADTPPPATNPNAALGAAREGSPITPRPISNAVTNVGAPKSGIGPTSSVSGPSSEAGAGPIGRTILGRYKIKRLIGEGGMGGVYEGEHLEIGKRVAIKLVHALHARDPHIAARIKQEARSTGAIESENIVQVFDAGEDPELGLFLVMEMLKGEDLAALLARRKTVSPMAAATMAVQAAQGLSRAHSAGIVHRDLKPANIFLCARDDGSSLVKLVDFGIAKLVRDANNVRDNPGLTRMGMVIGTPQYMSPEQAQGLLTVDHRTDIYSLAAVLFEAIVGRSPYPEMPTYEQTILQIMTRPAPRISSEIPDIHPELDRLCADMMAHDPNARPNDMMVVRERLVRIFPQIEGGRLPMRSLTNEANAIGYDQTLAADTNAELRAQVDSAMARAGLSGVGLAVARPETGEGAIAAPRQSEVIGVPGLPGRRGGKGVLLGVVGGAALAIGIGAVVLMKSHAAAPPPTAAGFGLVESTAVSAPSPAAPLSTPSPSPTQTVAPTAVIAPVVQAPPPMKAPQRVDKGDKSARPGAAKSAKVASGGEKAAPVVTEKEPSAARPVGGTSESTEF